MPRIVAEDFRLPAEMLAYKLLPLLPERAFRRSELIFSFLPPPPSLPGQVRQRTFTPGDAGATEMAEALAHLEMADLLMRLTEHTQNR